MTFLDWLRVIVLGIIEGVTEWLPVSSTGHLIILESIWKGSTAIFTPEFVKVFDVVIQFGAILAVVTIFFHKLNPVSAYKTKEQKQNTWKLWLKVIVAILPAVLAGLVLDDWMDEHLYNPYVVGAMLILYGVAFIVIEKVFKNRSAKIVRFSHMSLWTALFIGLFQCLALVPGTSRSGVTIIGALLLGCSRYIATEFTFYLAIPVMFGASVLKLFKYLVLQHMAMSGVQWIIILVAMAVAYGVSIFVIKFLVGYIKRHDFTVFGYYRIGLGLLVLVLFGFFIKFNA